MQIVGYINTNNISCLSSETEGHEFEQRLQFYCVLSRCVDADMSVTQSVYIQHFTMVI